MAATTGVKRGLSEDAQLRLNFAATRIYDSNSAADRIFCVLHGKAILGAMADSLKGQEGTEQAARSISRIIGGEDILAKMVLAEYSKKAPAELKAELISQAKAFVPESFDKLSEHGRTQAEKGQAMLASANDISSAITGLNLVLYYARDAFALANNADSLGDKFSHIRVLDLAQEGGEMSPTDAKLLEIAKRAGEKEGDLFMAETREIYYFLSKFDRELAQKLMRNDSYLKEGAERINDEGINGVFTHSLRRYEL